MLAVARLPHAWADGPIDHQRARQAMLAGEIRPLSDILQAVQPQLRGELMAIELEQEEGRWLYEFKVLEPGGRIVEWYVDARSAQVIKREVKAHKGRR
ncbi:hypothetical protein Tther_01927 [Tepidimonas thermarum]|uniref:PepSY domain-containing protein n=2 Tax=Tepidimonas thermarum TaxID=335431 RepID=A0A554WYM5_9BURK|nr:hypothetical protein Tther_01927 [Tepidimonas thermarum]